MLMLGQKNEISMLESPHPEPLEMSEPGMKVERPKKAFQTQAPLIKGKRTFKFMACGKISNTSVCLSAQCWRSVERERRHLWRSGVLACLCGPAGPILGLSLPCSCPGR